MNAVRLLALVVAVSLLVPVGAVGGVPAVRLTVSDAVVAPATPVVGEQVTVTVTVANSVGSESAVSVDQLRLTDGDREVARATRVGALSPGDAVTVPLAASFAEAGPRVLTLSVVGTDANDRTVRVDRPVPVVVESAPPLVELAVAEAAVESESRLAVSLSNPTTAPMRNLVVAVNESLGQAVESRRTLPTLAAGETATLNLSVVPDEPGVRTASVDVTYTTASGVARTTTFARSVAVDPFVDDVGLAVVPVRPDEAADDATGGLGGLLGGLGGVAGVGGGGAVTTGGDGAADDPLPTRYEVTATNFGTVPVDSLVLAPTTENETLPRVRLPESLAPGESATATLDLSAVRAPATVTLDATYRAGVRAGETNATFRHTPAVADVRLTDLDVLRDGDAEGRVTVSGNVANLGDADLTGVVVAGVSTDDVRPVYPHRDYFVGSLGGSDFAPFELTAAVNESAAAVPVRVTYRVDGERVERTVRVPLSDDDAEANGPLAASFGGESVGDGAVGAVAGGTGGALFALVAGVLAVGLLGAGALRRGPVRGWMQRRRGSGDAGSSRRDDAEASRRDDAVTNRPDAFGPGRSEP
jgi:hypothetical protein